MKTTEFGFVILFVLLTSTGIFPVASALSSSAGSGAYFTEPQNPSNYGLTGQWSLITPDAGWPERSWHCSVLLPDNSIVLMGGMDKNSKRMNDVWRSTDNGLTWNQQTANAEWSGRFGQNCVALPDGSIVLMGGSEQFYSRNDTWRSTDNGETWTRVNASPGWTERRFASSVVVPDGTIIMMGGFTNEGVTELNDVWKSTDKGATWQLVNANAAWMPRRSHSSVALQDGSITLMGGFNLKKYRALDDTWRSTDYGVSWNKVNSGTWPARYDFNSVVLPDDSIVIMGGAEVTTWKNDVWQSFDMGTTWQLMDGSSIWPARWGQSGIVTRDGSIVVMGGSVSAWQDGGLNDVWMFGPEESSSLPSSGEVRVTKEIQPYSIKRGTDARITITVLNQGKTPVHDAEILDTTLPEFPVTEGTVQYSTSIIEPGDTRILTYKVHATKTGSYRFNKTTVMYADSDGNYHLVYSGYPKVNVLESLLNQDQQTEDAGFFQNLVEWIKRL